MKHIVLAALVAGIATVPMAHAGPVLCSDACAIDGWSAGFVPPAQLVQSGASVSWSSLDANPHVNLDAGVSDACFFAVYGPEGDSAPIRFDIVGSAVEAVAEAGTANETVTTCGNAIDTGAGAFVINYFCGLHPALMKGVLVIVPDA